MNAPFAPPPASAAMMTGADYRESLRRLSPVVYVDGQQVESSPTRRRCNRGSTRSP
jgi:4-hydroxybutyryl-CoA dehydratase/vinylacetyl-CoA-Delta-isomerase